MDREGSQALAVVIESPWLSFFAQGLAFFAILTSFLAQALSLVHFLADGLKVKKKARKLFAMSSGASSATDPFPYIPQLFFKALNFAGGICAVVLFGILPVLMVWIGRYRKEQFSVYEMPGGKVMLGTIFSLAGFIFIFQLGCMFGLINLTH
jgi:tyrosine-specific transport protein